MTEISHLPPIALTTADRDQLLRLVNASLDRFPETADYLAREIERARIVNAAEGSDRFVSMGSTVEFRDEVTGQVRRVVLVYPDQADVNAGKISVLTPIGAALIGLSTGQSIEWCTRGGELRSLTVLSVRQAVRSGA